MMLPKEQRKSKEISDARNLEEVIQETEKQTG
jgi:hypothetical protein